MSTPDSHCSATQQQVSKVPGSSGTLKPGWAKNDAPLLGIDAVSTVDQKSPGYHKKNMTHKMVP